MVGLIIGAVVLASVQGIAAYFVCMFLQNLNQKIDLVQAALDEHAATPPVAPPLVIPERQEPVAQELFRLAGIRYQAGDLETARQLWEWALRHFELSPNLYFVLACRHNIALCLAKLGRTAEAVSNLRALEVAAEHMHVSVAGNLLEDVRKHLTALSGSHNEGEARRLFEQAHELLCAGKAEEARLLFEQAREKKPNDAGFQTRVLINLALCYQQLAHYSDAVRMISQAHQMASGGALGKDRDVLELLRDHFVSIREMYRCQDAINLSQESERLMANREYEESEAKAQQALSAAEAAVGRDHKLVALILHQIARSRFERGSLVEARECWEEAEDILKASVDSDEQLAAEVKKGLETCKQELGF